MNPIQDWLTTPTDYHAGRLLYEQYGGNAVLKRTLSHGPSLYNWSALKEELAKLARQLPTLTIAAPEAPAVKVVVVGIRPAPAATHPDPIRDVLLEIEQEWKPLYKEAAFLQSQLGSATSNQERCTMAFSILDKMDRVQELWDEAAYVREHGHRKPLPAAPAPAPVVTDLADAAAVLKRRNNLRAQISKQKKNPKRAMDVALWEAEVEMLDAVLKKLTK